VAKRTASAKKQARAGAKRAVRNRAVRSEVKTKVVKARRSLTDGSGGVAALEAIRALDRAAAKGVLHPKNAARRKGRLAKRLAKAPAGAAQVPAGGKAKKSASAPAAPASKKK
jgi:small subunit ribosomal protein S20